MHISPENFIANYKAAGLPLFYIRKGGSTSGRVMKKFTKNSQVVPLLREKRQNCDKIYYNLKVANFASIYAPGNCSKIDANLETLKF